MSTSTTYPIVEGKNCVRFSYNGVPRVIRLVSLDAEHLNLVGYETRCGKRKVNVRYAQVKSYKLDRIDDGKLKFSKN